MLRADHDLVLAVNRIGVRRGKLMLLLNDLPVQLGLLGWLQHVAHDHFLHKFLIHLLRALAHLELRLLLILGRLVDHRRAGLPLLLVGGGDDWNLLARLVVRLLRG